MGVSRALFWVDGGVWGIILGGWMWVGHYFGWVRVDGSEWWWLHCLIMPVLNGHFWK